MNDKFKEGGNETVKRERKERFCLLTCFNQPI